MSETVTRDQLRDQLLQQRLLLAWSDTIAAAELLSALSKESPAAGTDQEQRMRDIESAIQSIRWNCTRLREFKA